MKKSYLLIGLVFSLIFLGACTQAPLSDSDEMYFYLSNESDSDIVLSINIDGKDAHEVEISTASEGAPAGGVSTSVTIEVPDGLFTLISTELNSGISNTYEIDPTEGVYYALTFWGDKLTTQQDDEAFRLY